MSFVLVLVLLKVYGVVYLISLGTVRILFSYCEEDSSGIKRETVITSLKVVITVSLFFVEFHIVRQQVEQ